MLAASFGITRRVLVLVAVDVGLIASAFAVTGRLVGEPALGSGGAALIVKLFTVTAVVEICLHYADWYDRRQTARRRAAIVIRALAASSLMLAGIYAIRPQLAIEPRAVALAAVAVAAAVSAWHLAFEWLTGRITAHQRLLMIGTEPQAVSLARELFERRRELDIDIVGFIDPDPAHLGMPLINPGVIGTLDDIPSIVRARRVDRVVISRGEARGTLPMDALLGLKLDGVRFDHLASTYEALTGKIPVTGIRPSWLVFSDGFRRSRVRCAVKRAMDVVAALLGLVLASPVLLVVAAAVKATSRGPVLYSQRRVGQHGRLFTVRKLRSMRHDAEAGSGAVWAQKDDPRVTRVGRVLRRTRLDELPQLWNVLIGDMSLVGPRPERPEFVSRLTEQIPFYGQRHLVRPGLTGWAQVRYTYGSSVEDAMEKLQYDLFYIKHLSIALDLFIVLSTIKTVVMRKGAV